MLHWYRVLIAHNGLKMNSEFAAPADDIRTMMKVKGGLLLDLGEHEDPVPPQEVHHTYGLESESVAQVRKRAHRGKSAKAGQDDGAQLQPSAGVEPRDEGDSSHGGNGEG